MQLVLDALRPEFRLLVDLSLALVPLVLAVWLFRPGHYRGPFWWPGVVVFVLFLPNAPYILTDVLHLVRKIREQPPLPVWAVAVLVIPEYVLYILIGLQSYVISLLLVGHYLRRHHLGHWVWRVELALHLLCAFGIYLGRFLRLNSWDILYHTEVVAEKVADTIEQPHALVVTGVLAVVLMVLYYPLKYVDEAVRDRWHGRRLHEHGHPHVIACNS